MIVGTGLDIVNTDRIEHVYLNRPSFVTRILTEKERILFQQMKRSRQIEFLAGRFAAKEAYAKAKGCGIGKHLSFQDIEILPDHNGRPELVLLPEKVPAIVNHLSITHTAEMAAAQVVIEKSEG